MRNISAIAVFLSAAFLGAAPAMAAGASPAPGAPIATEGKTTGTAEVQNIQQRLDDAETSMMATPTTNSTAGPSTAAQVQPPVVNNPGTLAESASTTALSSPTYQQ